MRTTPSCLARVRFDRVAGARFVSRVARSRGGAITWMIVIVCAAIVGAVLVPNMSGGRGRSKPSRARSDLRSLETAIESYRIDEGVPPPVATLESLDRFGDPMKTRALRDAAGPLLGMPGGLTTPIAYISSYFPDPMSPVRGAAHLYYRQGEEWILISAGMDEDYDLRDPRPYFVGSGEPDPSILDRTYDPTNGVKSDGDIWRWSPRSASAPTTATLASPAGLGGDPRFR